MCLAKMRQYDYCDHWIIDPAIRCEPMSGLDQAALDETHILYQAYTASLDSFCPDCILRVPQRAAFKCQDGRYVYFYPVFADATDGTPLLMRRGYFWDNLCSRELEVASIGQNDQQQAQELRTFNDQFDWDNPYWEQYLVGLPAYGPNVIKGNETSTCRYTTGAGPWGEAHPSTQNLVLKEAYAKAEIPDMSRTGLFFIPTLADTVPPGQYNFPAPLLRMLGISGSNNAIAQRPPEASNAEVSSGVFRYPNENPGQLTLVETPGSVNELAGQLALPAASGVTGEIAGQQVSLDRSTPADSFDYGISRFGSQEDVSEWGPGLDSSSESQRLVSDTMEIDEQATELGSSTIPVPEENSSEESGEKDGEELEESSGIAIERGVDDSNDEGDEIQQSRQLEQGVTLSVPSASAQQPPANPQLSRSPSAGRVQPPRSAKKECDYKRINDRGFDDDDDFNV